jgi:uroporphyrinogen decarboxylase
VNNKPDRMTNGQRIEALFQHRQPDRVPLWPFFDMTGFAAIYQQRPIQDAYTDPQLSLQMQRQVCQEFGWICSPFFPAFSVTDLGGQRQLPNSEYSQAPSTVRFPIETEEDIAKMRLPNLNQAMGIAREAEFHRLAAQDRPDNQPFRSLLLLSPNPYEWAGRICRPEMLNRWLIKKPDLVYQILQITSALVSQLLNHWYAAFGTEDVLVMDGGVICSNQVISPKHFAQFVLPPLKEAHQKVLDKGYRHFYCHICGRHDLNWPYWQQIPMGESSFISVGPETNLETAARYFPEQIIVGNLQPSIVQTGSPEDVYQATAEVLQKGKQLKTGFVFSMGCQFPPRARMENVQAMNRAMNDHGWY